MDSCKVSRAAGAVPTRRFTPLHTPVHNDSFRETMCANPTSERHRASRARLRGAQGCRNRRAQQAAGTHSAEGTCAGRAGRRGMRP